MPRAEAPARAFPTHVRPMLAMAAPFPEDESAHAFEPKWDGMRAIVHVDRGRVVVRTRTLRDVTTEYPELAGLGERYHDRRIVLDGEIVAPDAAGRASFERLQRRFGASGPASARVRARDVPIVYVVFDVLHLDGRDTTKLPYEERRALLEREGLDGPAWRLSPARVGEGRALFAMPDWEGVVAKRLGSAYEPGARSRAWLKVKRHRRQEFVIGGWSAGRGGRAGRIGALLLGYYAPSPGGFVYAGSVGTGFTEGELEAIERALRPHERAGSPFATPVDKPDASFVEPLVVAEVEFTEWTSDGKLRHPSFKGIRPDKDPFDVVREEW